MAYLMESVIGWHKRSDGIADRTFGGIADDIPEVVANSAKVIVLCFTESSGYTVPVVDRSGLLRLRHGT